MTESSASSTTPEEPLELRCPNCGHGSPDESGDYPRCETCGGMALPAITKEITRFPESEGWRAYRARPDVIFHVRDVGRDLVVHQTTDESRRFVRPQRASKGDLLVVDSYGIVRVMNKTEVERTLMPSKEAGSRELLGKIVRNAWIEWALKQPDPKASWLVPWERMDERFKEVDRRIGEAVMRVSDMWPWMPEPEDPSIPKEWAAAEFIAAETARGTADQHKNHPTESLAVIDVYVQGVEDALLNLLSSTIARIQGVDLPSNVAVDPSGPRKVIERYVKVIRGGQTICPDCKDRGPAMGWDTDGNECCPTCAGTGTIYKERIVSEGGSS